jgi:hypothetical protein
VWRRPRRHGRRAVRPANIGEQLVVAEKPDHKILPLPAGEPIGRKRHTVEKGKPERLL